MKRAFTGAVAQRYSVKILFFKILQNLEKKIFIGTFFFFNLFGRTPPGGCSELKLTLLRLSLNNFHTLTTFILYGKHLSLENYKLI